MRLLLILCLAATGTFADVHAQTKPEPPPRPAPVPAERKDTVARKAEAPLPRIELPEYDITGTLVPGVANSNKLTGDENGALDPLGRKNIRAREPRWLDEGAWKLGAGPEGLPGSRSGKADAGYGSFRTPWLDLSMNPGNPEFDLAIRAGFRSSAGHVDRADYRRGYASLGITRTLAESGGLFSQSTLHASAEYAARNYTPFGALVQKGDRTLHLFSTGVSLQDFTLGSTLLEGGLFVSGASLVDSVTTQQVRFGAKFNGSQDIGPVAVEEGMEIVLSNFTAPTQVRNPVYIRSSVVGQDEVIQNVVLRGGVAGYVERGTRGDTRGHLYPIASVSWYPAPPFEVFVRFEPSVTEETLGGLVRSVPYIAYPALLMHEVCGTDLVGGMEVGVTGSLKIRLIARYRRIENYLSFVDSARVGLWDAWYDGVSTVYSAEGDLMWQVTDADLLTASLHTLASSNSVTGEKLPYLSPLLVDASAAHWFPFGLVIGGEVQMVGTRTTDLLGSRTLEPFVLLDVSADYSFLPGWRVRGEIRNLLGTRYEWWEGYAALPRTGSLGVAYNW